MLTIKKRVTVATLAGNVLEHYDQALYMLIAPFITHLFYPHCHPLTALILAYLPVSFVFRPLGALFFGYFGDRYGRKRALHLSIMGMSLVILLIGFVPTYKHVGIMSAVYLHLLRGLICFFAAGEGTAAALVLIEQSPKKYKNIFSSIYEMSSMAGVFFASILITLFTYKDLIYDYWRVLFIFSGLLGLLCFYVRKSVFEHEVPHKKIGPLSIKENAWPLISIILVTGFSVANYIILTSLMNGYIPFISGYSSAQMMRLNNYLIIYDFLMLPVFGYLAQRLGKERMIILALGLSAILTIPLFMILKRPTMVNIFFLRMAMVTWGIALASCYENWMISLVPENCRFRIVAFGKAIGAKWIGAPAISISLWLYQKTQWVAAPSIYITLMATLALTSLLFLYTRHFELSFKNKPEQAASGTR